MNYLHLGEEIDERSYIVVDFYVESELTLLEVAEALASESSIGTWTDLSTMRQDIFNRLGARIIQINDETNIVKIAYPVNLFEEGNLPQLLSDVAGNVFGLKEIINLRVKDIHFPMRYIRSFMGPALGIQGIRAVLDIYNRPLLGTIIKPKVGLNADEHAEVAYQAWVGGVDIVKDDENLTSQAFNPFEERIIKTIAARKKAEELTGKRKLYAPNISAPVKQMVDRAEFVKIQGGRSLMMDILTVGFAGVEHVRNQNFGLVLHGHRAMHGAFTHGTQHGIAMLPIAKISRLSGIDQLHTGTIVGKMKGGKEEVTEINTAMRRPWGDIKPTMPIASGGVHPGMLPEMMQLLGDDVIINLGGGIHGHPDGTLKGATAALQAVEATKKGKTLEQYAKDHGELEVAIEKWGTFENSKVGTDLVTYTYGMMAEQADGSDDSESEDED